LDSTCETSVVYRGRGFSKRVDVSRVLPREFDKAV
jgi:hypothetical protein